MAFGISLFRFAVCVLLVRRMVQILLVFLAQWYQLLNRFQMILDLVELVWISWIGAAKKMKLIQVTVFAY